MPLRRRDPGREEARQIIRHAFDELQSIISPSDAAGFKDSTIGVVRDTALRIEDQLASRSSLRNMRRLQRLFDGLNSVSKPIEILCNGTPYLPWVWAPIALILKVSSEYIDAFEKIVGAYGSIGEAMSWLNVVAHTYSQNLVVQQALALFAADIMRFHAQAYNFIRRGRWKIMFMSSWVRYQRHFSNVLEDIKRHESLVERAAQAQCMAEVHEWRLQAREKVEIEERKQAKKELQAIHTWWNYDAADQATILEKASSEGSAHQGTCEWIREDLTISSFLGASSEKSFVWLTGSPGTGKSVLTASLIRHLSQTYGSSKLVMMAAHFCNSSFLASTQSDNVLLSLLMQFIQSDNELISHVHSEYVVAKKAASRNTLDDLLDMVADTWSRHPEGNRIIRIIIDGADEITHPDLDRLIRALNRITNRSCGAGVTCKILISSRSTSPLVRALAKKSVVSLADNKAHCREAIYNYTMNRLKSETNEISAVECFRSNLKDLASRIADKADGMFLWARLVLDFFNRNVHYSQEEVIAAINHLPQELSEFYEQILVRITRDCDDRSLERLRAVMGWIAFAQRPLRKTELRAALTFSMGDTNLEKVAPYSLIDKCAPLIEQRRDMTYSFIHLSVKEHLQGLKSSLSIRKDAIDEQQALACTACLLSSFEVFQPGYSPQTRNTRVLKGFYSLQTYVHEHWLKLLLQTLPNNIEPNGAVSSFGTELYALLVRLDASLKEIASSTGSSTADTSSQPNDADGVLDRLKSFPTLHAFAASWLAAKKPLGRATKRAELPSPDDASIMRAVATPMDVLENYQLVLRSLRHVNTFSDVTEEEIEHFKLECAASAFMCRYSDCPRASAGFETESLRQQHEASHRPTLLCPHENCQNPPLPSSRALQAHLRDFHDRQGRPKQPRRSSRFPSHQAPRSQDGDNGSRPPHRSGLSTPDEGLSDVEMGGMDYINFEPHDTMDQMGDPVGKKANVDTSELDPRLTEMGRLYDDHWPPSPPPVYYYARLP